LVYVLAGEHAGGAARQPLPRGRQARGRRSDVRGPRASRHHSRGERHRHRHLAARRRQFEGAALMAATTDRRGSSSEAIDLASLEWSLRQPRSAFSYAMSVLTGIMTVAALVPLFSVLYLLIVRGGRNLGIALFRELPPAAMVAGGGFG